MSQIIEKARERAALKLKIEKNLDKYAPVDPHASKTKVTTRALYPTGKREILFDPGPPKPWDRPPFCLCVHGLVGHGKKDGCIVPGCGCLEFRGRT